MADTFTAPAVDICAYVQDRTAAERGRIARLIDARVVAMRETNPEQIAPLPVDQGQCRC